jgi:transposase
LGEKIAKLGEEMRPLADLEARMLATPDQQISLTDPDPRSMATSGRGSGIVGYNVQAAIDLEHHLIVAHDVSNVGTDVSQLAPIMRWTPSGGIVCAKVEVARIHEGRLPR